MRILFVVLAAVVHSTTALAGEGVGTEATVRVLCQVDWRDDMLQQPPPESGRSRDITLPLAALPADATVLDLVLLAEKHIGKPLLNDFINTLRIYRVDNATNTYERIQKRMRPNETQDQLPRALCA